MMMPLKTTTKKYKPSEWQYDSKKQNIRNKLVSDMTEDELRQALCHMINQMCKARDKAYSVVQNLEDD